MIKSGRGFQFQNILNIELSGQYTFLKILNRASRARFSRANIFCIHGILFTGDSELTKLFVVRLGSQQKIIFPRDVKMYWNKKLRKKSVQIIFPCFYYTYLIIVIITGTLIYWKGLL